MKKLDMYSEKRTYGSPTYNAIKAVSAALHTPQLGGGPRCHRGPKIQSCYHFAPQRKLRSPTLKYEPLVISEVWGPFERKVHYSHFGPL